MSSLSGLKGFIRTKDPQPPPHPIALRPEYIADGDTLLYVIPRGNSRSDTNYTVKDESDRLRFTVSGTTLTASYPTTTRIHTLRTLAIIYS